MSFIFYSEYHNDKGVIPKEQRFAFILHRRLVKPHFPVLLHCPACGRALFEVNSDTIELSNSFGVDSKSIVASDNWSRHRCHSCKASISILWK